MRVSSGWYRLARRQAGVTLVEMVIFIMIVSLSVAGILIVMTATTQRSADPMVQQQALLIAESYMEEILHKRFRDASPTLATTICPTPEVAGRAAYDNVCDYHGLNDNAGVVDQLGGTVTGLTAYNVSVTVTGNVGDATALGPTASQINNTTALRVLRVDVEVTNDDVPDFQMRLTGYRTNYYCSATETTLAQGCPPR
ncbi:MAG TPA: hypothetical protein VJB18_03290 [Burkholderiales bacterium]|nr:hypothetical protein [Burkholderiales bacterium]